MRKQTKLVAVLSAAALLAIGASMTSFAKGWTQEDGEWVYLDSDGDRVTEEWKKSGSNYYWLDEDGVMATDCVVEDDDDKYYVDSSGARVVNQWRSVENEDDETVGDSDDVDTLWYYFGSSGKAYKDDKKTINGKFYIFDDECHAISGWYTYNDDLYYLGTEDECWAYTGWNYLELDDDIVDDDDYDDEEWFYFKPSTGKAYVNARKYVEGSYYTFDENGVMLDKWVFGTPGAATVTAVSGVSTDGAARYREDNGKQETGWVYTYRDSDEDENEDEEWFYMDSKGVPFNYKGKDAYANSVATKKDNEDRGAWKTPITSPAAKVIKSKTYLFDSEGAMQTGVFFMGDAGNGTTNAVKRTGGEDLVAGAYYGFNKNSGSVKGQMLTAKSSVDFDGETVNYYFQKNGQAYVNYIADGVLYGPDGMREDADDGNSYEVIDVEDLLTAANPVIKIKGSSTEISEGQIIVSSSGKVKKSGSVKIDGIKYYVTNYMVDPERTTYDD